MGWPDASVQTFAACEVLPRDSSTDQTGGVGTQPDRSSCARAVSAELVFHVQPPKGCAICFDRTAFNKPSDPNWVATVGPMGPDYTRRHTAKVAELRKTDLRVDWSEVTALDGPHRIAFRHSEIIEEPF